MAFQNDEEEERERILNYHQKGFYATNAEIRIRLLILATVIGIAAMYALRH